MKTCISFAWDVYSKPTPTDKKETFLLFIFCFFNAMLIGGLLYVWMTYTLDYDHRSSTIVAGTWGSVIAVVLFLVHPVRCVFTTIIPSLGTKQGRKILISTALMLVATSCIANMTSNIGRTVDIIRCGSEKSTEKILSSKILIDDALSDMNLFFLEVPSFTETSVFVAQDQNADISQMRSKLKETSEKIKKEFTSIRYLLRIILNIAKKIIASAFILLLLGGSVSYLIGYLTNLKHDNIYITTKLQELLKHQGEADIPLHYKRKLVKTAGWKMTRHEVRNVLWGIMVIMVYGLLSAVVMGLDYFIFYLLQILVALIQSVPEINVTISVQLEITPSVFGVFGVNKKTMKKGYAYNIPLLPPECVQVLSPPEPSTLATVVALFLTALLAQLGEVYAKRIRRKISSSFYRDQEEQRICFLLENVKQKREEQENDLL